MLLFFMTQIIQFFIGILFLILAIPFGLFLAYFTKEELKSGKKYFLVICSVSAFGAIVSLILMKDIFLFTFLFIGTVAAMSLKK